MIEVTLGPQTARAEALYGGTTAIVLPTSILVHDILGRVAQLWPYETYERPSAQYVRELNFLKTRHRPIVTFEESSEVRSSSLAAIGLQFRLIDSSAAISSTRDVSRSLNSTTACRLRACNRRPKENRS